MVDKKQAQRSTHVSEGMQTSIQKARDEEKREDAKIRRMIEGS